MAEITILFRGEAAAPFARMLARSLSSDGRICQATEATTGEESFCVVDADSVPADVYEALLPEATLLYTADAVPESGVWASRTLLRPFAITELRARLPKAPTLAQGDAAPVSPIEHLAFLPDGGITYAGEDLQLTKKEAELLRYLYAHRGTLCTREEIVAAVWKHLYTGNTNLVDVYIRYLRAKLDERYQTKLIYAVRGKGYLLK